MSTTAGRQHQNLVTLLQPAKDHQARGRVLGHPQCLGGGGQGQSSTVEQQCCAGAQLGGGAAAAMSCHVAA